jgi:hypothetical protein
MGTTALSATALAVGGLGRTFIHEMTHAAQIHFLTKLDYLAKGLSTKVCEVFGSSPYLYGPRRA